MGINFIEWLTGKGADSGGAFRDVDCRALWDAGADYVLRKYAFDTCVDLIAAALGRADFREYRAGEEIHGAEWWLWNVEPNSNQNSSTFLHKLVDHLYRHNEALILTLPVRGTERSVLAVADEWKQSEEQVIAPNKYYSVRVGDLVFRKTFREEEVLRLKLSHRAMEPVLRMLGDSWCRMASLAQKHYEWDHGQHWKVHVDQITSNAKSFEANFAKMLQNQMKPFLDNPNAVLPEFDGYRYEMVGGAGGSSSRSAADSEDVRKLAEDIFNFTARGFLIPVVLVNGSVEKVADANQRFLTYAIDPVADQLQEEINRKRYGLELWRAGWHMRVDTSSILHYDLFAQAANIEKLIGSGYSPNETRQAAGQERINEEWADTHYLTKNIGTMAEAVDVANAQES